ncbi:MAG: hypothetical protein WC156_15875, partial [Pedobacter sp.]
MKYLKRRYLVFLLDLLFVVISYVLAVLLTFDFQINETKIPYLSHILPILLLCKGAAFFFSRLYRCIWKYASLNDGIEIFKIVSISSVFSLCTI